MNFLSMSVCNYRCLWVGLAFWLLMAQSLQAATVLGVISSRNTADVLSGAQQFLEANPQHSIVLRTTVQYAELSDIERSQLIQQADMVFAGGVFGAVAEVMRDDLSQQSNRLTGFVAVHSDRRLVEASRVANRGLLQGADIDVLMEDPPLHSDLDLMAWSQQRLKTFEPYRDWLLARTFWADRDSANMDGLFRHLFVLSGVSVSVPAPQPRSLLRFMVEGKPLVPNQLTLTKKKSWVAVLDYETGDRPGDVDLLEQLCAAIEKNGRGCLVVLAKWGEASVRAMEILAEHRDRISAIVSLQNFVVGGGEGRKQVNRNLAQLNVPVLKGIRLADSSRDEWLLSEEGLPWSSVHYRVAMPELQGIAEPLVVAAMDATRY